MARAMSTAATSYHCWAQQLIEKKLHIVSILEALHARQIEERRDDRGTTFSVSTVRFVIPYSLE
jgi:hypothetical protein